MDMKLVSRILICSSLFLSIACGKKEAADSAGGLKSSSVIIGDIDWVETEDLAASSLEAQNAKAVGKIDLPWANSRCTAFLISDDVIMTNQHCIEEAAHARGVTATFDLVAGSSSDQQQVFDCSEFVGNDEELDFALLRCHGSPGAQYGKVELAEAAGIVGSSIYVIHQNCDYYTDSDCIPTKKISRGSIQKIDSNGEYVHNADTLGGSSGSPTFGPDHKVVAIHHAGAGFMGHGYENYAVPMFKIKSKIQSKFPGVLDASASEPDEPSEPQIQRIYKNRNYKGEVTGADAVKAVFNHSSSGKVTIRLDIAQSAGDLDLYLIDESGKTVAKSISTTKVESINVQLAKGDYTVAVVGYQGAIGEFKLKINNVD